MIAVCYARVSTVGQADGYSLETQREATEALARRLGAERVLHVEDTYTGTELDRPALNALRDLVRRRACDLVVAYDPDRLARDLTDLLIVAREIDRAGVELRFVAFDWEDTPAGRLFLQMRGAIAEFEHALILERTSRGKAKKAAMGRLRTYARPYGYRFDRSGDTLVVEAAEAEWVRRVYTWYADEGLSTWAIAERLAALGVPGPRGALWYPGQVWRMLRSRTYAGTLVRKDERPEWAPVRVPAIVPLELWERAQRRLGERCRRIARSAESGLVRGFVRCGGCGRRLVVVTTVARGRRFSYYTCPGRHRGSAGARGERCTVRPVRLEALDALVWGVVAQALPRWAAAEAEFEAAEDAWLADVARRREEAVLRRRRAEEAEARVHRAYLTLCTLDEDAYRRHLESCRRERREAEEEMERLERAGAQRRRAREASRRRLERLFADGGAVLAQRIRRAIVGEVVAEVVLGDDVVEIRGAFDEATG